MAGSIVVDTNAGESALYEGLVRRFDGATVQRRKLDVGDVVLSAESGTVVVERKTWLDWAKSMTDGRYASQKARLRSLLAAAPAEEEEEEEEDGGGDEYGMGVVCLAPSGASDALIASASSGSSSSSLSLIMSTTSSSPL